ncbi:CDP-glycerol glycerophosphotransferase family protein [Alkalihalophilus sp. As8PL]|uniref:CDP-glycerol glycerophosphotransferase family protein n=1 Tax=Alkalihalophilus sp. As8PL TaxID=3237103 RepID=A0AB39BY85_9BACI
MIFTVLSWLPVKKKLIMFESFSGKQYSCNPRAIYEYLAENKDQDYDLVWSVNKKIMGQFVEEGIPVVERLSPKWFMMMARAEFWVTNSRMPNWVPKPKHTVYLQTWHGTPLKRLVADMEEVHMPGTTRETYIKNFHNESSHWDYLISPNRYSSDIFKRAFHFQKEMIESGYPRNDYLLKYDNREHIQSLKKKLQLPLDKKIVLYAPTWRDDEYQQVGKYKFQLALDLEKMKNELGSDCILLLRLHSFIADKVDLTGYEGFVYDFSNYLDINELYIISDLLITDYSSVFFDYANLKRPIIFYTYDMDKYQNKIRGFYFDMEQQAPGPIVRTTDEVIKEMNMFFKNGISHYEEKYNEFYKTYCYLEDGEASKRVVEKLFK